LRTAPGVEPASLAPPVRAILTERFPNFPIAETRPMTGWIEESVAPARLYAVLLGGFALQALLIASAGLYGLLAHSAALRRREIGIRLAIGARPSQVTSLLLGHGLTIVLVGTAIGSGGGILLADLLRTQLYGVQPTDPATLIAVVLTFAAVALMAMLLPAIRASRTDPAYVLRAD
jgi:ABC-type antimicrobial peptide transport system permease subunit